MGNPGSGACGCPCMRKRQLHHWNSLRASLRTFEFGVDSLSNLKTSSFLNSTINYDHVTNNVHLDKMVKIQAG